MCYPDPSRLVSMSPVMSSQDRTSAVAPLFGVNVRSETLAAAVDTIDRAIRSDENLIHAALNAAKVSRAARDPEFHRVLSAYDIIHADGTSIVWASRLLRQPLPERVPGIDLMLALTARAADRGYSIFLLGATSPVVDRCAEVLQQRFPGLLLAGCHHGYWNEHDPDEERAVVDSVRRSGADILFLAVPTPRKELFLLHHRRELGVKFGMGVGGAFDVVADVVTRAPLAWQRCGMEWAYRLIQEPRKMWKRYLVTNTHFIWLIAKELVVGPRSAQPSRDPRHGRGGSMGI